MKLKINKATRVFIFIMGALALFTVLLVFRYYSNQNNLVDPRVVEAIELYEGYNDLAKASDYSGVFQLMDSIESIYSKFPHYSNSYEIGVLYNNRAAAYLSMALGQSITHNEKDSLLSLAEINVLKSIDIYSTWLNVWDKKQINEIELELERYFCQTDTAFAGVKASRFIRKRAKEIIDAQSESKRRLSVSHTNRGLIYRHREELDSAINQYFKALNLWPENLTAENNLNIILNQPLKKPSIIRSIFPKDRKQNGQ